MLLLWIGDVCRSGKESLLSVVSSLRASRLYARTSFIGRTNVWGICVKKRSEVRTES